MTTPDGLVVAGAKNRKYFVAADVRTSEVLAVLEAEHEMEARHFFAAVCHVLQAPSTASFRLMEGQRPPEGTPVFHRQYLKTIQANAQEEARVIRVASH